MLTIQNIEKYNKTFYKVKCIGWEKRLLNNLKIKKESMKYELFIFIQKLF